MSQDDCLNVSQPEPGVLLLELNRPEARNALDTPLLSAIGEALQRGEEDDAVRAVVVTGGIKVFAAGADLREMAALDVLGLMNDPRPAIWRGIADFSKPLLAAVNGFALGAGCELALHADIVIAGESARFGQPEINLGIMPGAGGTQRLIRAVGKSRAMKLVLSGEFMDAREALNCGLVAEVRPPELSLERALELAALIASKPPLAVRYAKAALLKAFDSHLQEGLRLERQAFCLLGATEDRNEGIAAFLEKRKPELRGK